MRKGKETRSTTPPPTLTAKVTDPPTSLYPEAVTMQPNGQTGISMGEVTTKTIPQKPPSSLYPKVVIITQQDGQIKRKEEVTELSPDEKVRDIKWKIKSQPQLDGPTDPSSDIESTDEGISPITKGKAKKAKRSRRMDVKEDTSTSEEEEEGKTPPKNRGRGISIPTLLKTQILTYPRQSQNIGKPIPFVSIGYKRTVKPSKEEENNNL
ncbi:hypothetical protein JTB14_013809 [Gonioctena quinquepunctata]|nr:hypothetical protein JTB14_013809 [Gonioctena quinquepunctata]